VTRIEDAVDGEAILEVRGQVLSILAEGFEESVLCGGVCGQRQVEDASGAMQVVVCDSVELRLGRLALLFFWCGALRSHSTRMGSDGLLSRMASKKPFPQVSPWASCWMP
jgi:spore maturation protein SpmA